MKKIILIFIVFSVIFSCTEEQNNNNNNNGENLIETDGNIKINLLENQPDL